MRRATPSRNIPIANAPSPRAAIIIKGAPRTKAAPNAIKATIFSRSIASNIAANPNAISPKAPASKDPIRATIAKGTAKADMAGVSTPRAAASGVAAKLIAYIPAATIGRSR